MHRIYTEDKNREAVMQILDGFFEGFTVTPAIGAWKGQREDSLIIDIFGEGDNEVYAVAEAIRQRNGQESVLVAKFHETHEFLTAPPAQQQTRAWQYLEGDDIESCGLHGYPV